MDESSRKLPENPPRVNERVSNRSRIPEAAPRISLKRCKARELDGPHIIPDPNK